MISSSEKDDDDVSPRHASGAVTRSYLFAARDDGMAHMEIEEIAHDMDLQGVVVIVGEQRQGCPRLLTPFCCRRCCVVLILSCLAVSLVLAYVGGLVPRLHVRPYSRSCPEISDADRLEAGPLGLVLDREARTLSAAELGDLNGARFGFVWEDEDNATNKWRPQGISSLELHDRGVDGASAGGRDGHDDGDGIGPELTAADFLLVSWYGRVDRRYYDRGARVFFVRLDVQPDRRRRGSSGTAIDDGDGDGSSHPRRAVPYRHVLLVDGRWDTFPFLHAGGLAVVTEKDGVGSDSPSMLHVPDSRYPWNYRIRVFDLIRSLYAVPQCLRSRFFGYEYVLKESYSYSSPIKPSFLSYDRRLGLMLVGTFAHCVGGSRHLDTDTCRSSGANELAWFRPPAVKGLSPTSVRKCAPFFADMQGVASSGGGGVNVDVGVGVGVGVGGAIVKDEDKEEMDMDALWITSSYGKRDGSHLHVVRGFDPDNAADCGVGIVPGKASTTTTTTTNVTTLSYPCAGLEDLHIQAKLKVTNTTASGKGGIVSDLWMLTEFGSRIVRA